MRTQLILGKEAGDSPGRESAPGRSGQPCVCTCSSSAWEELLFPGDKGIPSQAKHRAAATRGPYLACLLSSVTFTFPSTRLRYNLGREQRR